MRILVNGLSARLGGGQTYLVNLLHHVPADGSLAVDLLCPDNLDLSGMPASVRRIPIGQPLDNPFRRAQWEARHLGLLARRLGTDLLFSPGGMLPAAAALGPLKTAVTFQNMLPFDHVQRRRYPYGYRRLRDWLLERAFSSAMSRADLVIFISRFARDHVVRRLGPLAGAAVVVPHGIDPVFFSGATADLHRSGPLPAPPYFLYVSFVDYYKSQIEVVQAYHHVRATTGTEIPLLLVGAEYMPYGEKLRAEIHRLGLADAVRITGNLPHASLPALYRNAEINLFASCTENCPNILLEMMASGRPALVSRRGPMPEFGKEAVTYFDPGDVDELAARWLDVLRHPDGARNLAEQAVASVSGYTWAKSAGATWLAIAETARRAA